MAKLRTADGEEIEWWQAGETSPMLRTTLTSGEIQALQEGPYSERCIAFARLSYGQLTNLYRVPSQRTWAMTNQRVGKRILQTETRVLANGLGRPTLWRLYHRRELLSDRKALVRELLKRS